MGYRAETGVIYCMTSPSGKRYVGQSWNFKHRKYYYKNPELCKRQRKLYYALKKYGFENFDIELLDYCFNQEQMDDSEIYWIKYYDVIKNGYNIREGGSKGKNSPETIEKIKAKRKLQKITPKMLEALAKHRGKKPTKESIEKMRKSQKGHPVSQQQRENIRKTLTGYRHTEEAKINMSKGQMGRKCSEKSKLVTKERNKVWDYELTDHNGKIHITDDLKNFCDECTIERLVYGAFMFAIRKGIPYKKWTVKRTKKIIA